VTMAGPWSGYGRHDAKGRGGAPQGQDKQGKGQGPRRGPLGAGRQEIKT
jgi:hypothetical protein